MSEFEARAAKHQKQLVALELQRLFGTTCNDSLVSFARQNEVGRTVEFVNMTPSDRDLIFQVQCKLTHRYCTLDTAVTGAIQELDPVIISAENESSQDLGVVVRIFTRESYNKKFTTVRPFNDKEEAEIRTILRKASQGDLQRLPYKYYREEQLLEECLNQLQTAHRLPIDVYGAELQFDGKLLTFYYTSNSRVDFRDLVRALFNVCNIRIKMRKTNQCKKFVPVASATAILKTGMT